MEANRGVGVGNDLKKQGLPEHLFASVAMDCRCRPDYAVACNRIAVPCKCYAKNHYWITMTLCIMCF